MPDFLEHTWGFFAVWILFTLVILPIGLSWFDKREARIAQEDGNL